MPAHSLFVLPLAYVHNPVTLHTALGFLAPIGWSCFAAKTSAAFWCFDRCRGAFWPSHCFHGYASSGVCMMHQQHQDKIVLLVSLGIQAAHNVQCAACSSH